MNTHTNHEILKDLFKPRSEEKEIEHDALLLMAGFLSEIEYFQDKKDISRKELAEKIKTSPSYLTQVFRSRKPLNFLTLAKIKRALNLRFEIKAFEKEISSNNLVTPPIYKQIEPLQVIKQYLEQTNDSVPKVGSKFLTTKGNYPMTHQLIKNNNSISFSYQ